MSQLTKMLIASTLVAVAGFVNAQTASNAPTSNAASGASAATGSGAAGSAGAVDTMAKPASSDSYVQKREDDATAKKEYMAKKKSAKQEYRQEKAAAKAAAKADLKTEKKHSTGERKDTIAADPEKPVLPGQPTYTGK